MNEEGVPSYNIQNKKFESLIVAEANEKMKDQILSHFSHTHDEEVKTGLLSDVQNVTGSKGAGKSGKKKVDAKHLPEKVDKFAANKAAGLKEKKEADEKAARSGDMQRERDQEEFRKSNKNALKNVIKPMYKLDARLNVHREIEAPPDSLFIGLGFDIEPEDKKKHYRRYFKKELELVEEVMSTPTPFQTYDITKGQARGAGGGFSLFGGAKKKDASG